MKLETFRFHGSSGWSVDPFPPLDSPNTLVIVFGAPSFFDDARAIDQVVNAYPNGRVVGCSTSGEIYDQEVHDESLSVAVVRFERTEVRDTSAAVTSADDSFAAGERLARDLVRDDLRGVLILSDGLNVNGSELVRGVNSVLPEDVVVTGGLAGDGDRFQRTWVIDRRKPVSGVVSAVGLYGDAVRLGHGSQGGWDIFGPERVVTRSSSNVLYELDGKPALKLYKEYLGERASGLPATALLFPLSLRATREDDRRVVRTVLSVDEGEQSMTFAGDLPEGSLAQLMRANFDRLVDGAAGASLSAAAMVGDGSNTLSIAISCVGRRLVLGERTEEEVEAALENLPDGCRQIGFYSYGEISPYASGRCDLHNQTMTLTAISEL